MAGMELQRMAGGRDPVVQYTPSQLIAFLKRLSSEI
jgi:hypothetical protein